jgi:hypothetical protein
VRILRQATHHQEAFVKSLYNERAAHYSETLLFLKQIRWVRNEGNALQLTAEADCFPTDTPHNPQANKAVAHALMEDSSPYQSVLADYLVQFHVDDNRIIWQPSAQSRLKRGGVRNFLMELGMLSHQTEDDSYVLHNNVAYLYLWAKNIRGVKSKTELAQRALQKDRLGTSAEIAVLEFERDRVGAYWSQQVEHIAAKNPGACFDIKSVSLDGKAATPRFIEVKAVSANSYQFFWTASEVEAARLLGESYFLYLLPVSGPNAFDMPNLLVVGNAYSSVYGARHDWAVEENVVVCRPSRETLLAKA